MFLIAGIAPIIHSYLVICGFDCIVPAWRKIHWLLLQSRDFKTNDDDPGKLLRYQAEALVYRRVPRKALLGIGCYNDAVRQKLESLIAAAGRTLTVKTTPTWYFS